MKYNILLVLLFGAFLYASAQEKNDKNMPIAETVNRHIYAVVIGISDYENAGIEKLQFAHKDAEIFAKYLKSKAGGSVPAENIKLLLNKQAPMNAIYSALDWLSKSCQKNDTVYFYFSGHGDVDDEDVYKQGFLLPVNSPSNNYLTNAVRLEDVNNISDNLSVKKNVKVIIITDACHSGRLVDAKSKSLQLLADQLIKVEDNQIRITSCKPEEVSAEDK